MRFHSFDEGLMKRNFIALAIAGMFAAPVFAQVSHAGGLSAIPTQYRSGQLPKGPQPAPRENRSTAWMDNRVKDFGTEIATRYLAMKKMADSWARRTGIRRNQYVATSPARA